MSRREFYYAPIHATQISQIDKLIKAKKVKSRLSFVRESIEKGLEELK